MENYVVIDLGSNSVRMAITRINADGSCVPVTATKAHVRLSEDMALTHELQPAAIQRTIAALTDFRTIYAKLAHVKVMAIATAATRQARNQKAFIKRLNNELGIQLNVISGSMEAYYDYLAVKDTLANQNGLILDTGGGSTELILLQNGRMTQRVSLPLGSVTVTQRFRLADRVAAPDLFEAMTYVNEALNNVWWLRHSANLPIIAVGGSNRTLAKINQRWRQPGEAEVMRGYHLSRQVVNQLFTRLVGEPLATRKQIAGLSKERADTIVGGLLPIILLMRILDSDRVIFSDASLRDGVLAEHLGQLSQVRETHVGTV